MNQELTKRLDSIERDLRRLESADTGLVREASGGGGTAAGAYWYFPAIPAEGTQIIWMRGCDFSPSGPFNPDFIVGSDPPMVWQPGAIDGFWWASAGDEFWKPCGGKTSFHRGRPGTFYLYRASVN